MSSSDHKLTAFEKWELPAVNVGSEEHINSLSHPPSARQLDELIRSAQQDGFQQGYTEGKEKGYQDGVEQSRQDIQSSLNNLANMVNALSHPVHDIDEMIVEQIFNIIGVICKRIMLINLDNDRTKIFSVIEQAVSELPVNNMSVKIKMHPVDVEFVSQHMDSDDADYSLSDNITLVSDESVDIGGCVVFAGKTVVDSELTTRIEKMVDEHYEPK